jgi:inosine-uridine nucleoside N-ribohydrolase
MEKHDVVTEKSVNLILDTDIGPDCDDAGALTLLHLLGRKRKVNFLAMTNCTSNPYGAGTIDAINLYHGMEGIPVGAFEKSGFLEDGFSQKYNKYITSNYRNRYVPPVKAPGALSIFKKALSEAEDANVIILAIGPLNNLAALIADPEGFALVEKKVNCLVSMAATQKQELVEWNIEMDIQAASLVCEKWPTPIIFSPVETGEKIITGKNFGILRQDHPVRAAYRIFNDGDEGKGRMSWDLTAVWYAVMGIEPFFKLSNQYDVSILENGRITIKENPSGRFRFLENRIEPEKIAEGIEAIWSA